MIHSNYCRFYMAGAIFLLLTCASFAPCSGAVPTASEAALLALLRSDASPAEKALACKKLAIVGSESSAPVLCDLLADPQLASWARIALEAIPGNAVDEAIVDSLGELQGPQLVGAINSIGVRRATGAGKTLQHLLSHHDDPAIGEAAAVALGRIGDESSIAALTAALDDERDIVRNSAAEGCMLCAEQLLYDGSGCRATQVYDKVAGANLPRQRILEATRGAILADDQGGVERLLKHLNSPAQEVFELGLSTACLLRRPGVSNALIKVVSRAPAKQQVALLAVIAYRGDHDALPIALELATSTRADVQVAAVKAVGVLGNAESVRPLVEVAQSTSETTVLQAVAESLKRLPGEEVDVAIVQLASEVDSPTQQLLIEAMGARRIDVLAIMGDATKSPDAAVRTAAWRAIGQTVETNQFANLIAELVGQSNSGDMEIIAQALKSVASRAPDAEETVQQLSQAMETASREAKVYLMQVVASIEGPAALKLVAINATSSEEALKDAATAALGKWGSKDAALALLQVAKKEPDSKYGIRALRGYLRIARQFDLRPEERLAMCEEAITVASRPTEAELAIETLTSHPSFEMLVLIRDSASQQVLKRAAPAIAVDVIKRDPDRKSEVMDVLQEMGFNPPVQTDSQQE